MFERGLVVFMLFEILDGVYSLSGSGVLGADGLSALEQAAVGAAAIGVGALFLARLTSRLDEAAGLKRLRYLKAGAAYVLGVLAVLLWTSLLVPIPGVLVGWFGTVVIGLALASSLPWRAWVARGAPPGPQLRRAGARGGRPLRRTVRAPPAVRGRPRRAGPFAARGGQPRTTHPRAAPCARLLPIALPEQPGLLGVVLGTDLAQHEVVDVALVAHLDHPRRLQPHEREFELHGVAALREQRVVVVVALLGAHEREVALVLVADALHHLGVRARPVGQPRQGASASSIARRSARRRSSTTSPLPPKSAHRTTAGSTSDCPTIVTTTTPRPRRR